MLNRDGYAVIAVPTDIPVALAMQQIKRLLPSVLTRPKRLTTDSKAQYPVATKPVLSSLHMHLRIWEGHNAYPEMKYHELADKLGLAVHEKLTKEERADFKSGVTDFRKDIDKSIKRRKILLVSRHLRIARQYIKALRVSSG
jgi:hypothetical protein